VNAKGKSFVFLLHGNKKRGNTLLLPFYFKHFPSVSPALCFEVFLNDVKRRDPEIFKSQFVLDNYLSRKFLDEWNMFLSQKNGNAKDTFNFPFR
jgi:hypothetical protein